MNATMRHATFIIGLLLCAGLAFAADGPQSAGKYDSDTLEKFAAIPVQAGGRIKPLDTHAQFTLLPLNGKRTYTAEGVRLTALEWFLDCLFYPESANEYRHFLLDNSEVVTNIGVEARKARDRYSYNDLVPSRAKLMELGQRYSAIPEADRSTVENMTVNLAQNLLTYESLVHYLDFARKDYSVEGSVLLKEIFSDRTTGLHTSDILAQGSKLRLAIMALQSVPKDSAVSIESEAQAFGRLFNDVDRAQALALFPPGSEEMREWYTPPGLLTKALEPGVTLEPELKALAALETMARSTDNTPAFKIALNEFHAAVVGQAKTRGEYGKVPMEVAFYNSKVFFYAQWLFVLGFLMLALSWLNLKSRTLRIASWAGVIVPWALLVIGITVRCIIRGRPPVTTLYETVLFITAVVVFVSLMMEYVNRQRIAIAIASLLGIMGMFLANKYELTNKQDTMPSLQAVLDTNFWLSTHVTIVTIGYAAGLLASGIAHVYVLGKLFKFKRDDKAFYRTITRMTYGVICFGLLTSFVGTVLGGIWANYSWGRFWGWDPKENGALMIVLCNLAILHARMGGYIRDLGISLSAIFAGGVVAFSWWGVNLLGVGLHSYGFTTGIWRVLIAFWSVETAMLIVGAFIFMRGRLQGPSQPDPGQPEASA